MKNETIHERYETLKEFLNILDSGIINLLIVKGDAGFGKTHRVTKHYDNKKIDYVYISNYVTPLSFYELLYEHRNKKVMIFDDVQTIDNPLIVSTLKAACFDINGNRNISYYSTSKVLKERNLPRSFKFKPKVVLIFNDDIKEFEPLIDRGLIVNLSFSYKDKLKILKDIEKELGANKEALDYIKKISNPSTKGLTIRTYLTILKVKWHQRNWKKCAEEILNSDEDLVLLIDLMQKCNKIEDAVIEWIKATGKGRRTFFYYKKKLKLK